MVKLRHVDVALKSNFGLGTPGNGTLSQDPSLDLFEGLQLADVESS